MDVQALLRQEVRGQTWIREERSPGVHQLRAEGVGLRSVCFPQAEGILRAWATPALKDDYGSDPVVTKIWNTTMMEVK